MKQGHREKLSVTLDPRLCELVRHYAKRDRVPKSRIIEEAVRLWERNRLAALAQEGYATMGQEDLADAEAYLPALQEIGEIERP